MNTEHPFDEANPTSTKSTADALPVPQAGGTTDATTVEGAAADAATIEAPANQDAAAVVAAPLVVAPTQPRRTLVVGRRVLRFGFTIALLAVGVYAGWQMYLTSRQVPVAVVGEPSAAVPAPAVVKELAAAIDVDDPDRIRTALSPQIFDSYAAELQKYDLISVDDVQTLGTYIDGGRSASMLVLHAHQSDTSPFTLFLVVITENGQIVRLR